MSAVVPPLNDQRLRDALEAVYAQFACPTPRVIEGCPCCLSKQGADVLLTTPLREITGQALWSYVSSVFYTLGSEHDFRYLLPRILDVAINDPGNSNDVEIVLGKLALANWMSWPSCERRAVEILLDVWFERALARDLLEAEDGLIGWEAEGVLCGAARAGRDITRWLARLQEPDVAPALRSLRERFPDQLSGFWDGAPLALQQLTAIIAPAQ